MKLRPIFGFKVKSQLCAWMTSTTKCIEGFVKVNSQLCAWMTSAAGCIEGFVKVKS